SPAEVDLNLTSSRTLRRFAEIEVSRHDLMRTVMTFFTRMLCPGAILLGATQLFGAAVSITPSAVSDTYSGYITLQVRAIPQAHAFLVQNTSTPTPTASLMPVIFCGNNSN